MNTPFFSIVTSTLNAARSVSRLLDSLASQTCRDFNWIVQDGASSDATMRIVEDYRHRLPEILANSSPDTGIYDAWNKALARWQDRLGEWVLFLGADDRLASPEVLARVQEKLCNAPAEKDFATGHILFMDDMDMTASTKEKHTGIWEGKIHNLSWKFRGMTLPHSGLFTRRRLFSPPCFSTRFRIAGDYDFILKHCHSKDQLLELDILITHMGNAGISSINKKQVMNENFQVIKQYSLAHAVLYYLFFVKGGKRLLAPLRTTALDPCLYKLWKKLWG